MSCSNKPEIERQRARRFRGQLTRERLLEREVATHQRAQAIDGRDGVNVDRVHVIDVVLHASRDRLELRDHRQQQAQLVQLTEDRVATQRDLARVAEQLAEQGGCLTRAPQRMTPARIGRPVRDVVARPLVGGIASAA